jgi:hypothetical protein
MLQVLSKPYTNRASRACQGRMNIRHSEIMTYQTLTKIFKKEIPYDEPRHLGYLLGFFDECYPSLIKDFMREQNISKEQILDIFNLLPAQGETYDFREALHHGLF